MGASSERLRRLYHPRLTRKKLLTAINGDRQEFSSKFSPEI
jgi:hypothetical protein